METLKKAVEKRILRKAKYTKRTGSPGSYKYQYGPESGRVSRYTTKEGKRKVRVSEPGSAISVTYEEGGPSVGDEPRKKVTKRPETKAERKLLARKKAAHRGEPSGLSAKVEQLRSELKKYKKDPKGLPSSILGNLKQLMERDKATQSYHWLAGFVGSEEKGKAIYGEMKKRGIFKKKEGAADKKAMEREIMSEHARRSWE